MEKKPEMTAAQLWAKKKKTRSVQLPSGVTIQMKESRLYAAMVANVIPLPILKRVIEGTVKEAPADEAVSIYQAIRQMGLLVMQVVAEPKIIDGFLPGPNEIALIDIPDEDIAFIVGLMFRNGEAESLTSFRDDGRGGAPRSDVPEVQPEAIPSNAG